MIKKEIHCVTKTIYGLNNKNYYYYNIKPLLTSKKYISFYNYIMGYDNKLIIDKDNCIITYDNIEDFNFESYILNIRKDLLEESLLKYLARNKLSTYKTFKIFINDSDYNYYMNYYNNERYNMIVRGTINCIKEYSKINMFERKYEEMCDLFMHMLFNITYTINGKNSYFPNSNIIIIGDNNIISNNDIIIDSQYNKINNIDDFIIEYSYYNNIKYYNIVNIIDNKLVDYDKDFFLNETILSL